MKTIKQVQTIILTGICFLFSLQASSQLVKNTTGGNQLKLVFENKVGGAKLVLGNGYTNPFGETYTIKKFRYYITQIQLLDSSDMSVQFFPNDYFLVDAGDSASATITVPLSVQHITSISFLLGVDSTANVSGVQDGALDPANGMFWTWNTGYIMAKFEGISAVAKVPGNAFSFDVGGFKKGENAARKIEMLTKTSKNKVINTIVINVDVNKWFNGVHSINIAGHPLCHEPGALAIQFADNYATMFSIQQMK